MQAEPEIVNAEISWKNCNSDTQDGDKDQEYSRMESNTIVKEDKRLESCFYA